MKSSAHFLIVAPLVLLTACSTMTTTTKRDFDRNAKFDTYKTYAWAPEPKTLALATPAVNQAIHAAVDKDLSAWGLALAQGKTPDFYVVYHVTSPQSTDVRHYTDWGFGTAYHPGYGFYVGWPGNPETYTMLDQNKAGALIVDFVEVRRQQLVWRGVAPAIIGNKEEANAANAAQAVHLLLAKYPPPAQPPSR